MIDGAAAGIHNGMNDFAARQELERQQKRQADLVVEAIAKERFHHCLIHTDSLDCY